jgi:hypothetical protein
VANYVAAMPILSRNGIPKKQFMLSFLILLAGKRSIWL